MGQKYRPFLVNMPQRPLEIRRYYRVALKELAFLRFVLEAYDGLAVLTSLPGRAEVEWSIPVERADEADGLAEALAAEMTLVPIPRPPDWPEAQEP